MRAYTLRMGDERADILKHLSIEEGVTVKSILIRLIDQYIEAHRETIKILSKSGLARSIETAKMDKRKGKLIKRKNIKKIRQK